ncbi:MAG: C_GCAxxG_C_C family protein [Paludibacteraceae bacterium]|nr:C_GCAxxG_C_C family protein [Paludibacteraceae bacterium]
MTLTEEQINAYVERAATLREQGFNCSQAVFAACAGLYGMDEETALRVSASFGGGIGQMRQTCGAACGMFLLAGLENGNSTPNQPQAKQLNYRLVQRLAADFKEHNGGIICADLLGLNGNATPSQKRPCKEMIKDAVRQYLCTIS